MTSQSPETPSAYDADRHENQIVAQLVAMYDSSAQAEAAQQSLRAAGVPDACMRLLAKGKVLADLAPHTPQPRPDTSFWDDLGSLFVPRDERSTFAAVLDRGHAMLVVTPGPSQDRAQLVHLIEATHPVDFDARALELGVGTGYQTAPDTTQGSPAAQAADARYREGRRETLQGASRVRSYVIDRADDGSAGKA